MSKIVIFGAAGKAGSRIMKEALARHHAVTAVVRKADHLQSIPAGAKGIVGTAASRDVVRKTIADADIVITAISSDLVQSIKNIIESAVGIKGKSQRLIHMGGGATLLTSDGTRILDLPQFPSQYRAPAQEQADVLAYLQSLRGSPMSWTFISPPPVHFQPGERTGKYRQGKDHPVAGADGEARISYEDYVVAMLDEIERPKHLNERFTVGY